MAFVKILSGNQKGKKIEIDRDRIVIGRAPENVVVIDDPSVSAKHCSILRDGRKFTLRDLDSTNGTLLNNVKISENRLGPKDVFQAGAIKILFDGDDIDTADDTGITPPTDTHSTVSIATTDTATFSAPAFGAKEGKKRTWLILIVVISLLALGALGWFFYTLFLQG